MANQTTRLIFLIKMTLGTILAIAAGGVWASEAEYSELALRGWLPGFIYTFFPLTCLLIMQWLLLSDYLPKWWVTLGIIGCIIAGITVGLIFFTVDNETYNSYDLEISVLNALIAGVAAALPQWLLLKGKRGYLWVLSNGLGRAIQVTGFRLVFYPPIVYGGFYLAFRRFVILQLPIVPLGLALGLYLYQFIYEPKRSQSIAERESKL
jgi:hypothetical protein